MNLHGYMEWMKWRTSCIYLLHKRLDDGEGIDSKQFGNSTRNVRNTSWCCSCRNAFIGLKLAKKYYINQYNAFWAKNERARE